MDLEDIGSKISQLTMYDVRRAYTGALNWALNVSEMEAKVKEATSDEKWGASSTQMQEIAQATNNFADFNEIMPAIYRNFMEREAREWRMIYKALQLLEYLVKHGSERVVDDARSHLGTIKILRNFHYIDEAGKDQGINVRTRSKELSTLLGDVEAIRQERRKARANRQKYTQGGGAGDFIPGSGTGRYGGFGSDSAFASGLGAGGYGGSSAGGSGGGGYGGDRAEEFDEYDAGDAEERTSKPKPAPRSSTTRAAARAPEAPAKAAPVVQDLFSFDDDDEEQKPAAVAAPAAAPARAAAPAKPTASLDFDDFDDFQAAPAAAAAAPAAPLAASRPAPASTPSYSGSAVMAPTRASSGTPAAAAKPAAPASSGAFGFDDLWAASSGTASTGAAAQKGKGKMSLAEMARDKSSSAVWGSNAPAQQPPQQAQKKPDLFDLL